MDTNYTRISPAELKIWMDEGRDFQLLDVLTARPLNTAICPTPRTPASSRWPSRSWSRPLGSTPKT